MRSRDSVVYTPVSLGPDTDDEETLVNEEVYKNDLAQIRALVESTGVLGGSTCPSCEMPFDKGKKRRLIDSCGHERCYSCLFRSEVCPLCLRGYDLNDDGDDVDDDEDEDDNDDDDDDDDDRLEEPSLRDVSSAPLSIFAPTDGWLDESSTVNSLCGSPRLRTKITTRANLPSRVLHQRGAAENLSLIAVAKNLKSKATSPLSAPSVSQDRQKLKMTQSCPTPPNQRRRFFLNPKVLRSSLAVQRPSRHAVSSPEPIVHDNPSALSVGMTSSLEGKASWPGVVLGKIKSLWSSSQGTANDGLNQLIGSSNKVTDDEGGCVKPLSSKTRKSSQSDLYMRLGLLLGSNRANASMESSVHPSRTPIQGHDSSAASFSSLTSFEAQTLASTNTSPVSTLTGTSSEAEAAAAALRCSMKPKVKAKGKTKSRDCDSAGSLASISTSLSASTSMSMSMSVSVSGLSNGSSSPLAPRRHSVNAAHAGQPDELGQLKNRRSCARRSARASNVKGPLDAKLRFVQRHTTQLNLKPLFFEVPLLEQDPLFAGRQWLLHELESVINGSSPGILLSGSSGTGKTALVLQLVEHSCFGRRKEQPRSAEVSEECDETEKQNATLRANIQHTNEKVLPVSLAQIFLLHFNLRFPTAASFDKVQPLLAVCLAALYPLTLPEIFYSVNSLNVHHFISWDDFLQRFKMLSGFLVKRLDNTYMFFHPSFREWLMRRDEGESTKFLCDYRLGHAAIAFRLSRLQAPLDGDKTLELGHHVLKAHVYRGVAPCWPSRDLQAIWLTLSTECISSALCTLRNIYSPNVKVSRLLLLAGASPNHITEYLGNAPVLCMYAHEGSVEMVSLLLEFGADVELTNSQGCTALSLAAARGHCDVVRRLAAAGASLGHVDMAGQCPLVHAARHGRLSVVGYLLACDWISENKAESGALEIDREEAAQQAVVAAASQGHEAVVEYLLDMAEVIVDRPDTLIGETALTVSAANGSTATVSALLAHGANPRAVNTKGLSPLMLAAREGHWGTAERLLQGDLSISMNTVTDESVALLEQGDLAGRTALMLAASEGHINLLELFLDKGSILETKDKEGLTALSWACVRGRVTAVQMLLDRGSDVNTNDNSGRTPLDLAAFQGNPKLVQLLLEKGAAVEHVDLHGMRPLDRAIGCRNIPVVQCFLRRGAKLGPATWAMAAGKPDVLIILLNKLLEDGNVLYRKNRLKEASHRYAYALRKFPVSPEEDCQGQEQSHMMLQLQTFTQLHLNFLLNLSRCKRKMNECTEAIELADEALSIRSVSYEAFYARAKARVDLGMFEDALSDVQEALQNAPAHNRQDRRVLATLKDEIVSWIDGAGTNKEHDGYSARSRLRASVDTLTEL
ncbi:PREDICTED: protein TANC1 isoform X4 [Vollenhovia emeryi]|uniref:protein TANC1 isoform X4 n=1 Tax=Vollenhovia emeryi TaxID=411798 RepID=UPI0005F51745|nr:PREDICTED: protein TANC1 isoform X4 [Vollenhovia emeryi]